MNPDRCPWCDRLHDGDPSHCMYGAVLVCGGRDYADRATVWRVLDRVADRVEVAAIRHGCARGADTLAGEWARERRVPEQRYPADWRMHGKGAGTRRNQTMLDAGGVACVVAFPGGAGTADMVRRARAAGLPVWVVRVGPQTAL